MSTLTKQHLEYVGAIRTPEQPTAKVNPIVGAWPPNGANADMLNYGGEPFTYDLQRKEFVFVSRYKRIVRLGAVAPAQPQYMKTGDTKLLDRSTVPLAPYIDGVMVDISNGRWSEISADPNVTSVGPEGIAVVGDRIAVTGSIYYDAGALQTRSFFMAEWPITAVRTVQRGPWKPAKGVQQGVIAGPIAVVPEKWRDALKGNVVSGQSGLPIISRQSMGPCAVSWNTNELDSAQVSEVSATLLVGYVGGKIVPGGVYDGKANDIYNTATVINGITFIGDDIVFIGRHGYGNACYGVGVDDPTKAVNGACFDPTNASKGGHAYPYRVQAWVYPVSDLVSVVEGKRKPYELTPTTFVLDFPIFEHQHYKQTPGTIPLVEITGAVYNEQEKLLYVSAFGQDSYGYEPGPLIHTYKVNVESTPAPTPVDPTTPAYEKDSGGKMSEMTLLDWFAGQVVASGQATNADAAYTVAQQMIAEKRKRG